jgi:hypothetical protein
VEIAEHGIGVNVVDHYIAMAVGLKGQKSFQEI